MRPLLAILSLLFLAACRETPTSTPEQALRIHFTCDTFGRLEPCGCFTGQHGGLTRLRSWLQGKDREGLSLRFDVGGALAGKHDYDLIQYGYLLKAYHVMGFHALNLGGREAEIPVDQLLKTTADSPVEIISASLVDPDGRNALFKPYTVIDFGQRRIGVIGLLDPRSCSKPGAGLDILGMNEALDRYLPELQEASDLIVALTFADESAMNRLASSYFELDLILGGDVGQPAQELVRNNESLIGFTTNEGRTVASLSAVISAGPTPTLTAPEYDVQLLWDHIPQDPELRQMVTDYRKEIRETELDVDRPARADPNAIPGVSAAATYVGSAVCQGCHQEDHAIWEKTGHAKAFDTLVRLGADADPHCIQCHTVGFGESSGYRREFEGKKLVDVSCESCHGPASVHVDEMTSGKPKRFKFRPLGAADCTQCHYGEFSRPFVWEEFWPAVEHGSQ